MHVGRTEKHKQEDGEVYIGESDIYIDDRIDDECGKALSHISRIVDILTMYK